MRRILVPTVLREFVFSGVNLSFVPCFVGSAVRTIRAGPSNGRWSARRTLVRLQVCQVREVEVLFRHALSGL
jgi:hypothetical protein